MTYQYGDTHHFPYGKRQRMREARVWWVDPPSYFSEGNYLAVAPEAAALPIDYLPSNCTTAQAADRCQRTILRTLPKCRTRRFCQMSTI